MTIKASKQRAFSLIELLIVVTLIFSITAAIGIRQFPSAKEINKRTIPESLYEIGKHARLIASETGKSVFIKFIPKNSNFEFNKIPANNYDTFAELFTTEEGNLIAKESIFIVCDERECPLENSLQEIGFTVVKGGINGHFFTEDKSNVNVKVYPSGICEECNFKQQKSEDIDEYLDELIYNYDMFSGSVIAHNSFGELIIEKE